MTFLTIYDTVFLTICDTVFLSICELYLSQFVNRFYPNL